jgi:DNA polymerase-4
VTTGGALRIVFNVLLFKAKPMKSIILHIDYNSYFATVEQQANPRLRGKPIGVTGGDRMERTVVGAASVEAKKLGVKTGMSIQEARKICPELILVRGDSDKYLACTKRFLNILKDYSPTLEIFSIDEAFMELSFSEDNKVEKNNPCIFSQYKSKKNVIPLKKGIFVEGFSNRSPIGVGDDEPLINSSQSGVDDMFWNESINIAIEIKDRIRKEVGEWITVSTGISYNKTLAKLAGSLYKPDGLHVIADEEAAIRIIDQIKFDDICGIGPATKRHLFNMGICDFPTLRRIPLSILTAAFKSYGNFLYNISRGINTDPLVTFYEKEEVKSVGHQNTISHDTNDPVEIQQILLKMSELIAKRLRDKKLVGKTVVCFFRSAFNNEYYQMTGHRFFSNGMQITLPYTDDGLDIFKAAWRVFSQLWDKEKIRLIGVSISNLKSINLATPSLLAEDQRTEVITKVLDSVNDRFGDFTLQRGMLLGSHSMRRKPNPFLSDRRFKIEEPAT